MISYSRILPVLIIVSILAFSVRLTEVVTGISNISASAYAKSPVSEDAAAVDKEDKVAPREAGKEDHISEEKTQESKVNETSDNSHEVVPKDDKVVLRDAGKEDHTSEDKVQESKVNETSDNLHEAAPKDDGVEKVSGQESDAPEWRDANDSDLNVAEIKLEMFEDLSSRRDQIEKAEKQLQVREALLKAAEKELDKKVKELTDLQKEIKGLIDEQGGKQEERIVSLVKIYEGMKPKDAARIFDTLDLDVLVQVMTKMSERKVAPVLAAMNPERARTVTIMMVEQKSLPKL